MNNIRLTIPKGGESGSETSLSLTGDDFQQRTLASLNLIGSDTTDSEVDEVKDEPTLEILPITIYVQTPTGRRIKLKDSIDVELMVETLEEMVTKELKAAHLLQTSESSSEELFRLYHDRIPMRRGNPITRYKIMHLDVLKLKFGTDEADANQKQERRKAYQKLERKKATRKSTSAENLRRLAKPRNQRASSSSPVHGARIKQDSRATSPQKQRLDSDNNRRNQLRKTPSNDILKRLSQSLGGLIRTSSTSSEKQKEQQQPDRRNMMKTRGDSAPTLVDIPHSRSGSKTDNDARKPRRNLKKKTEEESSLPETRSCSNNESRRKASQSKSRGGGEKNPTQDPTRNRKKSTNERRSRSTSKKRPHEENSDLRKRSRGRSRSHSRDRDELRNQTAKISNRRSSSKKEDQSDTSRRSHSGPKKSFPSRHTTNHSIPIDEVKKQSETGHPRKFYKRSSSAQELPSAEPKNYGIPEAPERKKQTEEVHPHKAWKRASSAQNLAALQASNDGIPDAFKISIHKSTKRIDSEKEKGGSPPSPVSVLTETLDMPHFTEDNSHGISDIQSHENEIGIYRESTDDKFFEAKRRENPKDTNVLEKKNPNKPKRMSLKELKEEKSKEEAKEVQRVSPIGTKPDNSSKTDSITKSSEDVGPNTGGSDLSNFEAPKEKTRLTNLRDLIEKSERRLTDLRDLLEKSDKNASNEDRFVSQNGYHTADFTSSSESSTIKPLGIKRPLLQEAKEKFSEEEVEDFPEGIVGVADIPPPKTHSIINRGKAKFENKTPSTEPKDEIKKQSQEKKYPRSNGVVAPNLQTKKSKDSSEVTAQEAGISHNQTFFKPLRPSSKDSPRSYGSDGPVAEAAAEAIAKLEASVVDEIKKEENSTDKTTMQTAWKPIQPSSRDTTPINSPSSTKASIKDRIGKFQNGNTMTKPSRSPKDRNKTLQTLRKDNADSERSGSIKDRIGKFQTGGKENTNTNSPESFKDRVGKFQAGGKDNTKIKSPESTKDRVGKSRTGGKDNTNTKSLESNKDRPGKIRTGGKENASAKPRGSIKDRIGKFQTDGEANTNASSLQMIGLATLGLKNAVTSNSNKKDDDSESTTYSFFCSNDEMTNDCINEYDSNDIDDSDYESDSDSDSDGEFENIHVIGPDLTLFEIPLDSDSETLGNIKHVVAEAAGIPVDELRLGLQNQDSDLEESRRTHLTDDFKLSPGDILAVQPSTVVVKLPDGKSKLELSVFPGTLLSDIKDYIAESTGTTPSRQLLYSFEHNFDEELEDDLPVATDCTLRLTVY